MHTGRGDRPFTQFLDVRDLDVGLGHTAYIRVSLTHQISFKSQKLFLHRWTSIETGIITPNNCK